MKNCVKRSAAVFMTAVMICAGAAVPAVKDTGLVPLTTVTVDATSVGKVTGLSSNTLSNSEIKLKWKKSKRCKRLYRVYA